MPAPLVCFGRVQRDWTLAGIISGILAASSTAGALVAFGVRLGTPARPFNAIGAILLGAGAMQVYGFAATPTIVGLLLHVAAMIACGGAHALLVHRSDGHVAIWAVVLGVLALAVNWVLARAFGVGLAMLLPVGNLIILIVVLVLSLSIGMRFAFTALYRE